MYSGIINVFKEKGYTSNDVVQIVKKITKSKAGHTGTLDPQATGVLPICLGRATKIADYIMNGDKEYVAEVILGVATDTQDSHGNIIAASDAAVEKADVITVLSQFFGDTVQTPPMYSAIKVKGKKLYEYARAGVEIERKQRDIHISGIEVLRWNMPRSFVMRVRCSKGTYIRTLCADIGEALGTHAHMGRLIRTRSSNFAVANSISLEKLRHARIENVLLPMESALSHLPKISISAEGDRYLQNGNKIPLELVRNPDILGTPPPYLTFNHEGELAGIFTTDENFLRPQTMLL